jgi:hypothetical protein
MANARESALKARRTTTKINILAPAATGISSIAKQNAGNETDIMIAKYNNGLIGNEEMKSFLQTQLANQYVSASDKVQIQTKLMDFDVLIEKDRLEAVFKSAPENSLQKAQAATALADFYNKRASTMVAGTQAHSQALENAGAWQQQVAAIQESTNKEQRKNVQNQMLTQINQLPNSSSEKATARADMYKKLYDMAISQGDTADAQVYAANYQQELSNATAYAETEANQVASANRKDVINYMNQAKNDYHDGKITADQYYQMLSQVNDYAVQNSDATLQNSVNSEADRVAKIEAKGGLNRGTAGGLPVVLKGSGTGGGGTITDWDQKAFDYSDNIRAAQEMLNQGKYNSEYFNSPQEQYQAILSQSVQEYSTALQEEYAIMEAIAQENPNQKVYFEGKKQRVADVVERLANNIDDISGQVDALNNGTAALIEIPPKQSATNPNGKAVTTYAFVDTNNIDPNTTTTDTSGILHQIIKEMTPMTLEQQAQVFSGVYTDPNGGYHKVKVDSAGNYSMETGKQLVETYEPGGTRKTVFEHTGEPIAPWNPESHIFETNKAQGETQMTSAEAIASQKKAKNIQAQQQALPKIPISSTPAIQPGKISSTPVVAVPKETEIQPTIQSVPKVSTVSTNKPVQMQSTPAPVVRQSTPSTQTSSTRSFMEDSQRLSHQRYNQHLQYISLHRLPPRFLRLLYIRLF